MADPNPKKELSMEQRLLLAFVLMGVVIFASQYLLPKPPSPPPTAKNDAKPAAKNDATAPAKPAARIDTARRALSCSRITLPESRP